MDAISLAFPHATRANAECNAPLSRVGVTLERGARGTYAFDAANCAEIEQRKAELAAAERKAQQDEFQRKLQQRLRKARLEQQGSQRNAAAVQGEQLRRLRLLAHSEPTTVVCHKVADESSQGSATIDSESMPPSIPGERPALTKLEEVSQSIEEKAAVARQLLLLSSANCECLPCESGEAQARAGLTANEDEVGGPAVEDETSARTTLVRSLRALDGMKALPVRSPPRLPVGSSRDDCSEASRPVTSAASTHASYGGSTLPRPTAAADPVSVIECPLHPAGLHAAVVASVRTQAAETDREAARQARERREHARKEAEERERRKEAQMRAQEAAMLREMERLQEEHARLKAELQAAEAAEAADARRERERQQKGLQTERYIAARRVQLKKEAAGRKSCLPPLCNCGLDPLDDHAEKCARNCVFFHNPEAYRRAISGLFVRPIHLDR
ncbi:hypothetical protein AB1Y20_023390 [Prymnesium parvum]|uniref:CXXC-type zinc finger protein 1 n=1 Tax=Prymnesium parvum TaxID=97485 RepID=A0AB34JGQ5_PRYPA